jgi:ATP-dependent RNA helicase RhlE
MYRTHAVSVLDPPPLADPEPHRRREHAGRPAPAHGDEHPQPGADAALSEAPAACVFAGLMSELQRAVGERGYAAPTPIQTEAIPHLLQGRDLLGCAQTGTGKTAAFVLPMLQHLARRQRQAAPGAPQALILAPTRELAAQIGDSISAYGRHLPIRHTTIFGGVSQHPQVSALRRGVHIVVATPGRLLDLMQQRALGLAGVEIFVLDEADRMMDMGFLPDIRRIIRALPARRQSLLFSATLPEPIVRLAAQIVRDPVRITVTPEQPAVAKIRQRVMFVDRQNKDALLADLLRDQTKEKVLVFARMKHMAGRIAQRLSAAGIPATAIHGNKSQSERTRALAQFKSGATRVLVATDIAARGLDVTGITHVINYDLPHEAETYVHRIGRTARAGAEGDAVSFCTAEERSFLRDIERLLRQQVPADLEHTLHCERARRAPGAKPRLVWKHPRGRRRRR